MPRKPQSALPLFSHVEEWEPGAAPTMFDADAVLAALESAGKPVPLDTLARQLQWSLRRIAGTLLQLEMQRKARRLPGDRYELCTPAKEAS